MGQPPIDGPLVSCSPGRQFKQGPTCRPEDAILEHVPYAHQEKGVDDEGGGQERPHRHPGSGLPQNSLDQVCNGTMSFVKFEKSPWAARTTLFSLSTRILDLFRGRKLEGRQAKIHEPFFGLHGAT